MEPALLAERAAQARRELQPRRCSAGRCQRHSEAGVDGDVVGATPVTIDLSVREEHRVTFRLDGYDDVTCILNRRVGTTWIILDILSGVVPIIIDAATGSWYELADDTCNVTLPRADQAALPQSMRESYAGNI